MSQKRSKKLRQYYRRDVRHLAKERAQYFYQEILKPRPRWVPRWLWKRMLKIFIRI